MLTEREKVLAADASVMLTKNKVIQEVYSQFGRLAEAWQLQAVHLPAEIIRLHPKISKGENYLGLPWVMMDYPRLFSSQNSFAIRTMFWWGHHFSLHLLLQGKYMELLVPQNMIAGWSFSTATTPWQHHYEANTSIPAEEIIPAQLNEQAGNGFYKLSSYLPLQQWDTAEVFLNDSYKTVMQMVSVGKY